MLCIVRININHWVKRSVGVAAHFFAKRCRDDKKDIKKAAAILELLTPQIYEWDIRILKGIGWGLETLGRYYPDLLVPYNKKANQFQTYFRSHHQKMCYLS